MLKCDSILLVTSDANVAQYCACIYDVRHCRCSN